MSDESPTGAEPRNDNDPAAQVAADLRARLRGLPPAELVEMAAQLVTTYVIEGVLPLARAGESTDLAADQVGEETFAQMLKRLKAARRDPVLDRFLIDGENISVRIDGQGVLPLTEYRRPTAPPPAAAGPGVSVQVTTQVRQPSAPGAAPPIYNPSLYQPEAPPPSRNAPAQPQPAQQRPAAQQPGQPAPAGQQPKKDEGKNDRFTLIELD
jgi:hypothetical protein